MTQYLTKQGLADLQAELEQINEVKIPKSLSDLNEARSEGDLSENSGYEAAKEDIKKLEAKRIQIEETLEDYELIEETSKKKPSKRVNIGGTVEVEYLNTSTKQNFTLTIVGSSESDAINGKISNESPIALAILGKKEGEEVSFRIKREFKKVKIIKIIA